MKNKKGYKSIPLSFNRRAVIASVSVTSDKNAFHGFTEIDITEPRRLLKAHFEKTGVKLSFTAYIVSCLAQVLKENPTFNSFIKGSKLIILDDLTISVLIEREISGEKVPEPIGIKKAQTKTFLQIHDEIRQAQKVQSDSIGSLSGISWFKLIPGFLLTLFVRLADKNIYMAKKYGKIAVTSVGMFSNAPIWFIPHGTATVQLTVGSINKKIVEINGKFESREHLCITVSFDHNIIDGAPAARFMNQFIDTIRSGKVIEPEKTL